MTQSFAALSTSIARIVASAAPLISAIRIAPNRHITGLVCQGDAIVAVDQALPALENYTVVLSNRLLIAARIGGRDPGSNIASLRLDTPWPATNPETAVASVGSLAIVVGADADASPTVRLTAIHRFIRTAEGFAPVLDLSNERVDQGALVLDPNGRLIGLAAFGPNGEAVAIPSAVISRVFTLSHNPYALTAVPTAPSVAASLATANSPAKSGRRGWLGVALQPITVPDPLVARAGQTSGRMVVSITKGGPAELAGVRVGDVVLALNGTSASGPHALRAFLGEDRVGTTIEIKLLRDGNVVTAHLTVAPQPG